MFFPRLKGMQIKSMCAISRSDCRLLPWYLWFSRAICNALLTDKFSEVCIWYKKHIWLTSKNFFEYFFNRKEFNQILSPISIGLHGMYLLYFSGFSQKYTWLTSGSKSPQYKLSCKNFQWKPSCSWRKDGRTDMTKLLTSLSTCFRAVPNTSKFSCADYEV